MKKFPFNFKSYEEYKTYVACLKKAKPLDKALIYINVASGHKDFILSNMISDLTQEVVVLGQKRNTDNQYSLNGPVLLLGTNIPNIGFWRADAELRFLKQGYEYRLPDYIKAYPNALETIKKYQFVFWGYPEDIRIAKLYLK